jgi:hypothetical protein
MYNSNNLIFNAFQHNMDRKNENNETINEWKFQ